MRKKTQSLCRTLSWMAVCILVTLEVAFGAAYFPPSPRPEDISEEVWEKLFHGKPVVIAAHIVTAKGVSWYYINDWDKSLKSGGFGSDQYYVRVEHGEVTVPYSLTEETSPINLYGFIPFGYHQERRPPWTSLGLTFPEAVEMQKQELEEGIQLLGGLEELRRSTLEAYAKLARGRDVNIYYDMMYPEVIEAYKQLGVLPKNFVPPQIPDRPQYTKEEHEAFRKACLLHRQQVEAEEAERKAEKERRRIGNGNPALPPQGP
ncbi:MAG: hypothetical protein PHO89_04405 [Methylacidiphilaceae bacterium]|nr:hypothetical protein [Candidatus Methylacidiphilaceae bacterium]